MINLSERWVGRRGGGTASSDDHPQ
jgi:hypothetical protein